MANILLTLQQPGHVYIQGEPGLGKTELVDYYLTGKKYWKAGESSAFLFGTLPEDTEYVWFEDFDMNKYHQNLNNMLSLMDGKQTTVSRKCIDDKTVSINCRFIFTSNYPIGSAYPMLQRRVTYIHVCHKMYDCRGCRPDFIPDNQLGLFDIDGEQFLNELALVNDTNFTLDISDEQARSSPPDGLHNIMTTEEINQMFEAM